MFLVTWKGRLDVTKQQAPPGFQGKALLGEFFMLENFLALNDNKNGCVHRIS